MNPPKGTYTAALVGLGRIGWRFDQDPNRTFTQTHAGAYINHPRFELIGAADVDEQARRKFSTHHTHIPTFASLENLLNAQVPDCLSIATHADSHLALVHAAVDAGVRAIWCEKPIATTKSEGHTLVTRCREANVILAINHWRRWDDTHINIGRWLDSGAIGSLRQVTCYYGAGIWNTGIHLFDLLEQWFGPVAWLQSSPPPQANLTDPDLDLMGGFVRGGRFACRALPVKQDYLMFSLDIFCSDGRLEVITNADSVRISKPEQSPTASEYRVLVEAPSEIAIVERNYMINAADDLARCLDNGTEPACTGEDGLRAFDVVLAAVTSASHQQVVDLAPTVTSAL